MQFSNDSPGKTIGSVMVLQALVSRLVASHPERDDIMNSLANFSVGIRGGADEQNRASNFEAADFIKDIADGMDDTVTQIGQYLSMIDGGKSHLKTTAPSDSKPSSE